MHSCVHWFTRQHLENQPLGSTHRTNLFRTSPQFSAIVLFSDHCDSSWKSLWFLLALQFSDCQSLTSGYQRIGKSREWGGRQGKRGQIHGDRVVWDWIIKFMPFVEIYYHFISDIIHFPFLNSLAPISSSFFSICSIHYLPPIFFSSYLCLKSA